jgi:hypothetical protein
MCPLHTPNQQEARTPYRDDIRALLENAAALDIRCFDGVDFPDDIEFRLPRFDGNEPVTFRHCKFGKAALNFNLLRSSVKVVLINPTMSSRLVIVMPHGRFEAKNVYFTDKLTLNPYQSAESIGDFSGSHFFRQLEMTNRWRGTWNFAGTVFYGRIKFPEGASAGDIVAGSTNVNFFGSRFETSATPPDAQGDYRTIREGFEKVGDRENHAHFHKIEMRCERFGRPLGMTRVTSAFYDWLSSYGSSYIKPMNLWLGLQCLAGVLYAWASPKFSPNPGLDLSIPVFTLGQSLKPFELLGLRVPSDIAEEVMGGAPIALWAAGTILHSALSLLLFGLFVLALRWRFKRD